MSSLSSQLILKKNILTEKSNKLEILNTELLDVIKKQSLNLEINEALIENEIKYINEYLKDKEKSKKITDKHFFMRHLSELDFFELYIDSNIDNSNNIFCKKGFISSKKCLNQIKKNNPDIIIVYGS